MLSKKIKQLRNLLDLTQQQCADAAEVNIRLWQKWEYGEYEPNISSLKKIAKVLKVEIQDLIQ